MALIMTPMDLPDDSTPEDLRWGVRIDEIVHTEPLRHQLPCELAPDLYLGSVSEALNTGKLKSLGITHVLNMASGAGMVPTGQQLYGDSVAYYAVPADDDASYDLLEHFDECRAFQGDCRAKGGKLFIHCMAGINRSGAMAVALLVADGWDLLDAIRHAHARRGAVVWNKGFQLQLVRFARKRGRLGDIDAAA